MNRYPDILGRKQVPEHLRRRGIRWINPGVVRNNFQHEHAQWESGFRAGYLAATGKEAPASASREFRIAAFERYCMSLGFSSRELDEFEQESKG